MSHENFMQNYGWFPTNTAPSGFRNIIEKGAFANDFANSIGLGLSNGVRDWTWNAFLNYAPDLWGKW